MAAGGKSLGEERLAVGLVGGKRVIVAQVVAEFAGRIETSYKIGPDTTTVAVKLPFGLLQLSGTLVGGKLSVMGTDGKGKPVALSAPLPAGAFLAGPGIGGSIMLAEKLAGMKVGDKRVLASLEIRYFPATEVVAASYDVERKPDVNGHQVFAVTTKLGRDVTTGELVLDGDGFVVAQKLNAPFELQLTRRPQ